MLDKFIYFTDPHAKGSNIETRKDNYPETFFRKLKWLLDYCNKRDVKNLVCGGDLFENPNISDYVAGKIAKLVGESGVQFYFTIGNHDITGKNPATYVNGKLSLFEEYDWFHFIGKEPIEFNNTVLYGVDYNKEMEEETYFDVPSSTKKFKIMVLHHMIVGDEDDFIIDGKRILISYKSIVTNADLVLCGHFHPGFPIKENTVLEHKTIFANPGSLLRTDSLVERTTVGPGIVYFSVNSKKNLKIKYVKVPCEENVFKAKGDIKYEISEITQERFVKKLMEFKNADFIKNDIGAMLKFIKGDKDIKLPFDITDSMIEKIIEKVRSFENVD